MTLAVLLTFSRIAMIFVFATAFVGKARDSKNFQETIIDFRLLPARWSARVTWLFLAAELITVLCIMLGGATLFLGFLLADSLLLVFSTALVIVLRQRARITCNCFGWTDRRISFYDVARNTIFLLCSLLGMWIGLTARSAYPLSASGVILVGMVTACFIVLVTNLGDVVETLKRPFRTL